MAYLGKSGNHVITMAQPEHYPALQFFLLSINSKYNLTNEVLRMYSDSDFIWMDEVPIKSLVPSETPWAGPPETYSSLILFMKLPPDKIIKLFLK